MYKNSLRVERKERGQLVTSPELDPFRPHWLEEKWLGRDGTITTSLTDRTLAIDRCSTFEVLTMFICIMLVCSSISFAKMLPGDFVRKRYYRQLVVLN